MIEEDFYKRKDVNNWEELLKVYNHNFQPKLEKCWIFRGEDNGHLTSKLEKALIRVNLDRKKDGNKYGPDEKSYSDVLKEGLKGSDGENVPSFSV